MGGYTLDADEHPESEGGSDRTREARPAALGQREWHRAIRRSGQHPLEVHRMTKADYVVLGGMTHDRHGRIVNPEADPQVLTNHCRRDRRSGATDKGDQCQ